jgi:16S rRNA (cytidine1402-2'-O)-methyltransferase
VTPAPGRLVLVATPIGNLGDLSPRAVTTLAEADVILCEDTRRTRQLLTHAGISRPRLVSMPDHKEAAAVRDVLGRLDRGEQVVLVTDAGMPAISDPGHRLVAAAAAAGHVVEVVPGPSAAIAALAVSGLPTARFCFEGFLPRKGSTRTARLDALRAEPRTVVLYEAPHRLRETLADLAEALGPTRQVALARELTKLHEETWRGTLAQALDHAAAVPPRGEYVLVLAGAPPAEPAEGADIEAALQARLTAGMAKKEAVAEVAGALGVPKRAVYDVALGLTAEAG